MRLKCSISVIKLINVHIWSFQFIFHFLIKQLVCVTCWQWNESTVKRDITSRAWLFHFVATSSKVNKYSKHFMMFRAGINLLSPRFIVYFVSCCKSFKMRALVAVLLFTFLGTVSSEPFIEAQDPSLEDNAPNTNVKRHHNSWCSVRISKISWLVWDEISLSLGI